MVDRCVEFLKNQDPLHIQLGLGLGLELPPYRTDTSSPDVTGRC